MVQQAKWVTLSFENNIPPGKYPALAERLAGTPARLAEKINNAPFLLLTQPYNNGWSIQEHAGHLLDLDELLCKRLDDFEHNATELTVADMSNRKTYDADHNDHNINAILKAFKTSRQAIIKRLMAYDEDMITRTSLHPRLKTAMRLIDIVQFFAEHDDHHLAIMTRIINESN